MAFETVLYEKRDGVAVITMNRPQVLNALNNQLHEELGACWEDVKEDDAVQVAVVTGAGRGFCAGADMKERALHREQGSQPTRYLGKRDWKKWGLPGPHESEKPLIAAINGFCVGGGQGIAMDCDIRIASTAALFGDMEIQANLVGPVWTMARLYPQAVAADLALTGDHIDAQQAYQWGFVSRLVEPEQLMPEALAVAEKITSFSAEAVQAYKALVKKSQYTHPSEARDLAELWHEKLSWTQENLDAARAFTQRENSPDQKQ